MTAAARKFWHTCALIVCAAIMLLPTGNCKLAQKAPSQDADVVVQAGSAGQLLTAIQTLSSEAAASSRAVVEVTQNISLGSAVLLDIATPLIIRGDPDAPPTLKCKRSGSAAFTVMGGRVTLQHLVLSDCSGTAVRALGATTKLLLDNVTVTGCAGDRPGSALVKAESIANLTITKTAFVGNNFARLLWVEQLPTSYLSVTRSTFKDNRGSELVQVNNIRNFKFDNKTLVQLAWEKRFNASIDVTNGRASNAFLHEVDFSGNTITEGSYLIAIKGVRMVIKNCAFIKNMGFDQLMAVTAGGTLFQGCRFINNIGASTGTPALLSVQQSAAATAFDDCTIANNSNTAGIFHEGFTHWLYYNTSASPRASKLPKNQADDKFDRFWSVKDLNHTLQDVYYNGSKFESVWKGKNGTYKNRWQKLTAVHDIMQYERRHDSPLMLRNTTVSGNNFTWAAILNRGTTMWMDGTRIWLQHVTLNGNTIVPPPKYNSSTFHQPPALVSLFGSGARFQSVNITDNRGMHIVHLSSADLNMTDTKISGNNASDRIMTVDGSNCNINGTSFSSNHANQAEVLYLANAALTVEKLDMRSNAAVADVMKVQNTNILNLTLTTFEQNSAGGGSVCKMDNVIYWHWKGARFLRNKAGANILCIQKVYNMFDDNMQMHNSLFQGNMVDAKNASNATSSGEHGGALVVYGNVDSSKWLALKVINTNFSHNRVLAPNTSVGCGGAVRTSGQLDKLMLSGCNFLNNSAPHGGALHLETSAEIKNCSFDNNSAAGGMGGAIASVTVLPLLIRDSNFTSNHAGSAGAIGVSPANVSADFNNKMPVSEISGCNFVNNTASNNEPRNATANNKAAVEGCPPGGGGALCLQPLGQSHNFTLLYNSFNGNNASYGGAIYIDDLLFEGPENAATMCGNKFANNTANQYGGRTAYYTWNGNKLVCIEDPDKCRNMSTSTMNSTQGCRTWLDDPQKGQSDALLATGPNSFEIVGGVLTDNSIIRSGAALDAILQFKDAFNNNITPLPLFPIITDVEPESTRQLVIFGNRNKTTPPGEQDPTNISNIFIQPNGAAPNNTKYRITLSVTAGLRLTQSLSITIRQCNIGERQTETFACLPCSGSTFSNDPMLQSCSSCPPGGNCNGGVLIPKDNYWQSSPRSPQVHRCPLSRSCIFSTRTENLTSFMTNTASPNLFKAHNTDPPPNGTTPNATVFGSDTIATYRNLQCRVGHTGTLCGVCNATASYGRFGFSCVKCLNRNLNNLFILVALLLLGLLLCFTVFSHIRATAIWTGTSCCIYHGPTSSAGSAVFYSRAPPSESLDPTPTPSAANLATPARAHDSVQSWSDVRPKPAKPSLSSSLATSVASGLGTSPLPTMLNAPLGKAPPTSHGKQSDINVVEDACNATAAGPNKQLALEPDLMEAQNIDEPVMSASPNLMPTQHTKTRFKRAASSAKAFLTVAKIFISYVQVVSITRNLQLVWPRPLQRVIASLDFTSAASSYISLECSISGTPEHKAILQTILIALLPVLAMAVAALIWTIITALKRSSIKAKSSITGETPLRYFRNRMILTIVQICYYTYPLVAMTIFEIFTWTTVDDADQDDVARKYAADSFMQYGKFWTQHYDTKCFEGNHLRLALFLGIPGLILFAIGFPAVSALQLWRHNKNLDEHEIVLLYGFLYEEYKPQYYYWETLIMFRKAALLVCTVFLRPFGAWVQLFTANLLLAACVFAQASSAPFDNRNMNRLENVSLFTTQLTLLTFGCFLPSVQSGEPTRILITVILALGNLGVMVYFLVKLMQVGVDWIRTINFRDSWSAFVRASGNLFSRK